MSFRTKPSRRMFPHQVDVQARQSEATSSTGGLTGAATTIQTNVPCLIVRKRGHRAMVGMHEQDQRVIRVLFPDPIQLNETHQLVYRPRPGVERVFQVDDFVDDLEMGRIFYADCQEQEAPTNG